MRWTPEELADYMNNLPEKERLSNMFGCVEMEEAALQILKEVLAKADVSFSYEDFQGDSLKGFIMLAAYGWLIPDYPNGSFVPSLSFIERITKLLPIDETRRHLMEANEFHIEVRCANKVYREEWLEMLCIINSLLQTYKNGQYANVGAYLEEVK
jgi:hypothetical protein